MKRPPGLSTTCTRSWVRWRDEFMGKMKLGQGAVMAAVALALAGPAQADLRGCFWRSYDAAHLARHPAQVVAEISVAFGDFAGDEVPWMDVLVRPVGEEAEVLGGIARCTPSDATLYGWSCSVECDGGSFDIEALDDRQLRMSTDFFLVGTGDDCGGQMDLAERPAEKVTYVLSRMPDGRCAGRWD